MPIIYFILVIVAYVGLGTLILKQVLPKVELSTLAITLAISNLVGFFGVVCNGIIPNIPLSPNDQIPFVLILYLGLTVANTIALKIADTSKAYGYVSFGVIAAGLNLLLIIPLGLPCFYAALAVSKMLFST